MRGFVYTKSPKSKILLNYFCMFQQQNFCPYKRKNWFRVTIENPLCFHLIIVSLFHYIIETSSSSHAHIHTRHRKQRKHRCRHLTLKFPLDTHFHLFFSLLLLRKFSQTNKMCKDWGKKIVLPELPHNRTSSLSCVLSPR